jgi:membrane dipeptidase
MSAMHPLALLLFSLLAAPLPAAPGSAEALHRQAIVVDTHADSTGRIAQDGIDFAKEQPDMHLDLPKMQRGGLDAQFFSIFVGPWEAKPEQSYPAALKQFAAVHNMLKNNPRTIAWAKTAAEVRALAQRGQIAALFGVEGGHMLQPGTTAELLAHLNRFYELGARYLTLTWSIKSPLGGSSGDDSDGQGLTPVGREILDEMQRLGMVVDISHVSDPLFWDVIRYVKKPVLASHSSARALANVPRNLTDAMLKAVARNGGAVCVNYNPGFLDADYGKAEQALTAAVLKRGLEPRVAWQTLKSECARLPKVPLSKLIDHIDHIAKVAGIDHVCLGSDFDGITGTPAGLEDGSKLPAITAELRKRGYSPADVEKILGENTLRVLAANEPAVARPTGAPR